MTFNDFQKKYIGKAVDYDKVAGVQCVDLVDQYLKEVFGITGVYVGGAKELYNRFTAFPALVQAFVRSEHKGTRDSEGRYHRLGRRNVGAHRPRYGQRQQGLV